MRIPYDDINDPLSIIEHEAKTIATLYGAKWCDEAGAALVDRISARLGGVQVYMPRTSSARRRARDMRIQAAFNGKNIREIATRFEVSDRTVRRIVQRKLL